LSLPASPDINHLPCSVSRDAKYQILVSAPSRSIVWCILSCLLIGIDTPGIFCCFPALKARTSNIPLQGLLHTTSYSVAFPRTPSMIFLSRLSQVCVPVYILSPGDRKSHPRCFSLVPCTGSLKVKHPPRRSSPWRLPEREISNLRFCPCQVCLPVSIPSPADRQGCASCFLLFPGSPEIKFPFQVCILLLWPSNPLKHFARPSKQQTPPQVLISRDAGYQNLVQAVRLLRLSPPSQKASQKPAA
jgi:hypothetical protein